MSTIPPIVPGALPLLGHLWLIWKDPLGFFQRQHSGAGVVATRLGRRPMYLVTQSDLVRELLMDPDTFDKGGTFIEAVRALAGNGVASCTTADHKVQRPMLQPAFHHRKIVEYSKVMQRCAEDLSLSWSDGQHLEMVQEMHTLAAEMVVETLFSGGSDVPAAAREIQRLASPMLSGMYRRMFIPVQWVHKVPVPANQQFDEALRGIGEIIERAIAEYRSSGGDDRGDLLSAMMQARDERTGKMLTDHELKEQVISMLMAAIETNGSAAAWLFHSLAEHQHVEETILKELRQVVGDRQVRAEDLRNLPLLKRALAEVLRLYPSFWLMSRVTTCTTILGGYCLPAHADVVFSLYCLHRNPETFPLPHRFDPDRWLPERVTPAQKEAQMPFGYGTRKCIGDVYGMIEVSLIVTTVLRRWQVRHATDKKTAPLVKGTMRPSPLRMIVSRRPTAYE